MNNLFNQAIEAHVEWKRALRKSLESQTTPLNLAQVTDDRACEFGQWLYGEGSQYSQRPAYKRMCETHARFHQAAAEFVRCHTSGDKAAAAQMLKADGPCSMASSLLIRAIMDCANELNPVLVKGFRNTGVVSDVLNLKTDRVTHGIDTNTVMFSAMQTMVEHDIKALAVYAEGRFIGILSEHLCLRKLVELGAAAFDMPVSKALDPNPVYVTPGDSIDQCIALIAAADIQYLAVLDDSKLLGIIHVGDLIKQAMCHRNKLIGQLQDYIHGSYWGGR